MNTAKNLKDKASKAHRVLIELKEEAGFIKYYTSNNAAAWYLEDLLDSLNIDNASVNA